MYCSNCGAPVPDEARFCPKCGSPTSGANHNGPTGASGPTAEASGPAGTGAAAQRSNIPLHLWPLLITVAMGLGLLQTIISILNPLSVFGAGHWIWPLCISALSLGACIADIVYLSSIGIRGGWKWSILIPPLYLFLRASKTDHKYGIAVACLIILAASIVLQIWGFALAPRNMAPDITGTDMEGTADEKTVTDVNWSWPPDETFENKNAIASTPVPTPTPVPTATIALSSNFALTAEQAQDLSQSVAAPLLMAEWYGTANPGLEYDNSIWAPPRRVSISQLAGRTVPGDVDSGSSLWTEYVQELTDRIWSDDNIASRGQRSGVPVSADTVQRYFQDAFGDPTLANVAGSAQEAGQIVEVDEAGNWWVPLSDGAYFLTMTTPPTSRDVTDGTISFTGWITTDANWIAPLGINLYVEQDPASRYGCHVLAYEVYAAPDSIIPANIRATKATPTPVPRATGFDENGFVFADSSVRYLTDADLAGLSDEMLGFARNEIFARNGNIFRTDKYANHYGSYSWYRGMPNKRYDIEPDELNRIEQANIGLIQQYEQGAGASSQSSREAARDANGWYTGRWSGRDWDGDVLALSIRFETMAGDFTSFSISGSWEGTPGDFTFYGKGEIQNGYVSYGGTLTASDGSTYSMSGRLIPNSEDSMRCTVVQEGENIGTVTLWRRT